MSFTGGSLADGQVDTTTGTIYTVPASTVAIIKSLAFYNTNVNSQTLNLYVTRSGGTRRQLCQESGLAQFATFYALSGGEVLVLSAGDVIEADTTTTTAVDYLITGATE